MTLAPGGIAPDGTITATVNDTGGPVEAQAQIRFSPAVRTGMLSGTLKERPEAAPALRVQLDAEAARQDRSRSWITAAAIAEYLARREGVSA